MADGYGRSGSVGRVVRNLRRTTSPPFHQTLLEDGTRHHPQPPLFRQTLLVGLPEDRDQLGYCREARSAVTGRTPRGHAWTSRLRLPAEPALWGLADSQQRR